MTAAIAVGLLVAGGVYLVLQRGLVRVVIGFVLLGHAVNVLVLSAGGMDRRGLPLIGQGDPDVAADPLPQAFVLTAIVITFAITVYLLALVRAGGSGDDESGDDGAQPAEDPAPADGEGVPR
jgi:multicomponent Na+:H+ antiporter subunit C